MTQKRVKASDVIGNSYYIYTLESSNNTPALNGTINITCNVTNVYGQAVSGKSITLYQNSTSKGAKTTDSNGNASWNSISMSSAGLQTFKVENTKIEIFVDNKADVGHTHSQYLTEHQSLSNYVTTDDSRLSDSRTPTSHTHGNINNNGTMTVASSTMAGNAQYIVYSDSTNGALKRTDLVPASYIRDPAAHSSLGTSAGATQDTINNAINSKINDKLDKVQSSYKGKNVVTNASTGAIEFEDKPTIPSASSTTPSADTTSGSVGTGTTWARSNHTHPQSSLYAESSHNHTKSQITDFPTIPSKTSDLQNDSGFLTSHQSLSGYLQTSDVKDNLTSTDTDKPLSAKQGKELKSLIDNKEDKIYRIVGTGTQIGTLFPNRVELQGTFPFDSVNGKIIVYVVPDISSLSEDLLLDLQGTYPSGSTTKFNIRKSNDAPISIGEIQTGDELLLFYDNSRWRLIGNSSISDKIDTAGTGLSKSGTTLNHSNSITALTTASFKKVKYDGQGHITGTSDVGASDLPSHNHTKSQITDFPSIPSKTSELTNDSGFLTSHQSLTGYLQQSDVKDNLTSTDTNKPLSAKQGKELKTLVDGKADSGHTHSQYLTEHQSLANYVTTSDSRLSDSRTPTAHATSATTYGVSSASNYGHAMASSTSPKANGTAAVGSETAKFARGDHVHPHSCVNNLTSTSAITPLAANQGKVLNDTKLDIYHYATTTFSPQTYATTVTNASFTKDFNGTMNANGVILFDFSPMFQYQDDTIHFSIVAGSGGAITLKDNYDTTICTVPTSGTYIIDIYIQNSINIEVTNSSNNTTVTYNVLLDGQLKMTSTATTTFSLGEKQWHHRISFIDMIYPIGSIYMSTNSVNPSLFIGGEWEQIQDRFLLASGSTYGAGNTGGSADAVVVSHSHSPTTSNNKFLVSPDNVAVNSTHRAFPATGSSAYFVYVADTPNGINENANTTTVGVSGTNKNMPPYLVVYMWKRIA